MADPSANIPNPPDPNTLAATMSLPQSPGIAIDAPAPPEDDNAQIPPSMLGAQSPMDTSLSNLLKSQATKLLPQALQASVNQAKNQGEESKAEAEEDQKYRERMDELYKTHAPGTVEFGGRPNKPEENPLHQFGSLASMLGIFGSMFTRKAAVNGLNASSAAMNAARNHDAEAYDNAYKAWQDGIKDQIEGVKLDRDALHDGLDMLSTDHALGLAQIKAYAAANNWPAAAMLAEAGQVEELAKLAKSLETASGKTMNFKTFLAEKGVQDFIAKNGRPPTFEELIKINAAVEGKNDKPMPAKTKDVEANKVLATDALISDLDKLSALIEKGKDTTLGTSGYAGRIREGAEWAGKLPVVGGVTKGVQGMLGVQPKGDVAHEVGHLASEIQDRLPGELTKMGYGAGALDSMKSLLGVRTMMTNDDEALKNVQQLKEMLQTHRESILDAASAAGFDLEGELAKHKRSPTSSIPAEAIQHLKDNPDTAKAFEDAFGVPASTYLGK